MLNCLILGEEVAPKGSTVRRIKRYMIWVQNVDNILRGFLVIKTIALAYIGETFLSGYLNTNHYQTTEMVIPREILKYYNMQDKFYFSLSNTDKAYLAGFLDGDGSILTQIIPDKTRTFKFYIRISIVFYQKSNYHWFMLWLQSIFKPYGYITQRNNMSEFVLVAKGPTEFLLKELYPYLKLKKPLCKLVLSIFNDLKSVNSEADFLKVCQKVDETANFTYSKTRKIDSLYVARYLSIPVETSDSS